MSFRLIITATLIGVFSVLATFLLQGTAGFSLWDEGFLWYGVQAVQRGEIPVRDFWSYDPGRYYWSAFLAFGRTDIMAVRTTAMLFQLLGVVVGLICLAKSASRATIVALLLSSLTLVLWMFPRHKFFDASASLILIGVLTFTLHAPNLRRYFIAGLTIGLIALIGKNHGAYGLAAFLSMQLWIGVLPLSLLLKRVVVFGLGVAVGYLPLVLQILFLPGYWQAFKESILIFFELKRTNIPLPVPWPWLVSLNGSSIFDALPQLGTGIFLVLLPVFSVGSLSYLVACLLRKKKAPPVLVASAILSVPYTQYAFSRADVGHLALSIFPLLIGGLAIISRLQNGILRHVLLVVVFVVSLLVMGPIQPGWQALKGRWPITKVNNEELYIEPRVAAEINLLTELEHAYAEGNRSFLAMPFWPGAFALFNRQAPVWEIYSINPKGEAFQQQELDRLRRANPAYVLLVDLPLDGREDLRYAATHPVIYGYIRDNFRRMPIEAPYELFVDPKLSR